MTLFDIDETEAARQLTLPLFELYARIKPAELFNQAWNSAKLRHRSPNVVRNCCPAAVLHIARF